MRIEFLVQGRESTPYQVVFEVANDILRASCDCAASVKGQACKHRIRIIEGSSEGVVSKNVMEIKKVSEYYRNSELAKLLLRKQQKENQVEDIKKEIKLLNKDISQKLMESA